MWTTTTKLNDMKTIDEDQFNIDGESKRKNLEKTPDSTIHSSEKLKNRASDFGKDLTRHITDESISEVDKEITGTKDQDEITGWDFGKRFWGLSPTLSESGKNESDKTEQKETFDKEKVSDDSKLKDKKEPFLLDAKLKLFLRHKSKINFVELTAKCLLRVDVENVQSGFVAVDDPL